MCEMESLHCGGLQLDRSMCCVSKCILRDNYSQARPGDAMFHIGWSYIVPHLTVWPHLLTLHRQQWRRRNGSSVQSPSVITSTRIWLRITDCNQAHCLHLFIFRSFVCYTCAEERGQQWLLRSPKSGVGRKFHSLLGSRSPTFWLKHPPSGFLGLLVKGIDCPVKIGTGKFWSTPLTKLSCSIFRWAQAAPTIGIWLEATGGQNVFHSVRLAVGWITRKRRNGFWGHFVEKLDMAEGGGDSIGTDCRFCWRFWFCCGWILWH